MSKKQRELNYFVLTKCFNDDDYILRIPLSNEGIHYWITSNYHSVVVDNWLVDFVRRFFCDFEEFYKRCYGIRNPRSYFNLDYFSYCKYKTVYQQRLFKRFCDAVRFYIYKVYADEHISGMEKYVGDFGELEPFCSGFDLIYRGSGSSNNSVAKLRDCINSSFSTTSDGQHEFFILPPKK